MIVGWRAAKVMTTYLTLDALEQVLWARKIKGNLIYHSDHGSQYSSIRYTERLVEAKVTPSVGDVGDGDNALAETINGLFKTEVIYRNSLGKDWKQSSALRSTGSIGSTRKGYSSLSAISLRRVRTVIL